MELGNLIFGHSRGECPLDRHQMEKVYKWNELVDKVGLDGYGYYNGKWGDSYKANIGGFKNSIFEVSPYFWGECESHDDYDDSADGECDQCKVNECFCNKPNFTYFPDDITISWYKYPWRDSYSNTPLNTHLYNEIFQKCIDSLQLDEEQKERENLIQRLLSNAFKVYFSEVGQSYQKQQFLAFRIAFAALPMPLSSIEKLKNKFFREIVFNPDNTWFASSKLKSISYIRNAQLQKVERFNDELAELVFVTDLCI